MKQKLLLTLVVVAGCVWQAVAQFAPQGFNYQSVVRDADGMALANQTVTLLFTIRSGAPNGPIAYAEKQTVSTNEFGLINLAIGQGGQPQLGDFTTINWGGGAKFLTVSLETSPGSFAELGASQLMSVPFALYAQAAGNPNPPGDDWGAQTAQTSTPLTGNGTPGNPITIAQQGAQPGQVLKWNGSNWVPQNDNDNNGFNGTVTQINTGAGLTGGPITNSGTIALTNTGITPGFYGSASQIPVIQIDAQGRIVSAFTVVPQPGEVDINSGSGINVVHNGFNDFTVNNTGDTNPNDDVTTATQAGGDMNGPFSNLQINAGAVGSPEIANNAVGNSELSDGAVTNPKIANGAVTAAKLDDMSAANGQVLKWNGTAWAPAADVTGITSISLTGGAGINVTGSSPNFTITNTGDTNPNDDLTSATQAGGDLSGPFSNLQIDPGVVGSTEIATGGVATVDLADEAVTTVKIDDLAVTTNKIANGAVTAAKLDDMSAANGQVLKWNGTNWAPAADGGNNYTAGPGISITGLAPNLTINNTGDTDASNDLTTATQAGGDLSGPFSNLQINVSAVGTLEIAAGAVNTSDLADEAVTTAKLDDLAVTTDKILGGAVTGVKIDDMGANNGQVLKWNGLSWSPANDLTGSGGDDWGNQVVQSNNTLSGNGTAGTPLGLADNSVSTIKIVNGAVVSLKIANDAVTTAKIADDAVTAAKIDDMGASNGQVLKWNGANWAPANDQTGGGGGDDWGDQVVQTNNTLEGDGTDVDPLGLADGAVTTAKIADGAVTGPKIDDMGAANGQVLKFINGEWTPSNDIGGGVGDDWGSQVVQTDNTLSGDGTAGDPLKLAAQGATNGQVLKFDGAGWTPADDAGGNDYAAGPGISITGSAPNFTINNTGDTDPSDDLTNSDVAGGDVTGLFANLQIVANAVGSPEIANNAVTNSEMADNAVNTAEIVNGAVTAAKLDDMGASNGQVLKWNGTTWAPANDGGGNNYAAGSGISITGLAPNLTINNTGDADANPTNELQTLSLNGTTLKISQTNSTVKLDTVLASGGLNLWKAVGNNIHNNNPGNVGINTNAPATKLHVVGNGEAIRVEGVNPLIGLAYGAGAYDGYIRQGATGLFVGTVDSSDITLSPGGAAALVISGNTGNVGIGGPNGSNVSLMVFHEKAGLNLTQSVTGDHWEMTVSEDDGSLQLFNNFSGGVPAGVFATNGVYTPSDRRLKRDVIPLSGVLDNIMRLQPVAYHYKQERPGAGQSIGFLAQDVQTLFPELVGTTRARDGQGEFLSLNYAGFSVLAVKAIQEQQARIEVLKSENDALQQRMEALEARLKLVEDRLPR